jgi:putative ABC transport system permease protein
VRGLFFREGLILSAAGSAIGALGAIAYAALIMWGLRTWWVGAVGTTALEVRPSAIPLLTGAVAGLVTSLLWIAWALWRAARAPARSLLKGALDIESLAPRPRRHARAIARVVIGSLVVIALLSAATFGWVGRTAGFFGAGAAALATALAALGLWLRKDPTQPAPGAPWRGLGRLGLGNARARAGRTALATALIAFATFVIVSVGAFRREGPRDVSDKTSGTGGFAVIAESVAPLLYDPGMSQGREAYGLDSPELQSVLAGATFARFRLRPGDDGSCLNLYRPENPRILGVPEPFVSSGGRFTFAASLAATEAERHNPWRLLDRDLPGGVIPAIVDATSLTYVFHKRLGDEMAIERSSGQPVTLRFVASLSHSIFQSELLIADRHFVRLFPDNEGFRVWLVDVAPARAARVMEALEDRLSDAGVEARGTDERLRAYERVENTYLSTFQALGALGLVLGTLGVGAVLLRNVLERQREIALLQAVGYQEHHVRWIVLAETAFIVLTGVAIGIACALLAVQPALAEHGGRTPWLAVATVVAAVAITGWLASVAATSVALRLPILSSLKSE